MIGRLKALFEQLSGPQPPDRLPQDGRLAAAALMVEAARLDGAFDAAEREAMHDLLTRRFDLTPAEADDLIAEAAAAQEESAEFFRFTHALKEVFSHDERVQLIEQLWEVAYADGRLHDHEASLLRRVAGLLYVSDRERGEARRRVLDRMGLAG